MLLAPQKTPWHTRVTCTVVIQERPNNNGFDAISCPSYPVATRFLAKGVYGVPDEPRPGLPRQAQITRSWSELEEASGSESSPLSLRVASIILALPPQDGNCKGTPARAGFFYAGQDVQYTHQSQGKECNKYQTGAQRAPRLNHHAFPSNVTQPLQANTSGTGRAQPAWTPSCAYSMLHNCGRNTSVTNVPKTDYPSGVFA